MPSGSVTSGTASSRSTSRERERFLRQPFFHARQFQLAGRVVQDDVLPGEPAEEVFERCPAGCAACSSPAAGRWPWCNARASAGKLSRMGRVIWPACFKSRSAAQARNTLRASRRPSSVPGRVVARGQRFQVGVAPQRQRVGRAAVEVVRPGASLPPRCSLVRRASYSTAAMPLGRGHGYVTTRLLSWPAS